MSRHSFDPEIAGRVGLNAAVIFQNIRAKRKEAEVVAADHHARLACWICESHPMCQHITPTQTSALLASELVTEVQVQAAGLRS